MPFKVVTNPPARRRPCPPQCAKSLCKFNPEIVAPSLRPSCVHQLVNYANASAPRGQHGPGFRGRSVEVVDLRTPRATRARSSPPCNGALAAVRPRTGCTYTCPPSTDIYIHRRASRRAAKMIINRAPRYTTLRSRKCTSRQLVELCKYIGL